MREEDMRIKSVLSAFSLRDLKRLVKAKALHAACEAAAARVESLRAKLRDAESTSAALEQRLVRLLRNGKARGRMRKPAKRKVARASSVARNGAARPPRKGSLRAHLHAALASGAATAKELATRVSKAGYQTKSNAETFAHAVRNTLYAHREFLRVGKGRFALKK